MKREDIKLCLELAIGMLLIVLAVKLFIKALPIIVIALVALLVYDSYKRNKSNKPVVKKKDNGIQEAKIIKEKNID